MAANGSSRGSLRPHNASRSPSFVIIGLLVVIAIIGFNYWNVSSRNNELRSTVLDMTDRLRLAGVKRLSIEKRNDALADQMKQARQDVESSKSQLENKEKELLKVKDELDARLKDLQLIKDEQLPQCQKALETAKANSSQLQDALNSLKEESAHLQNQIQEINAQRSSGELCRSEVNSKRLELLQRAQQVLGQSSINLLQQQGVDVSGLTPLPDNQQQPQQQAQPQPQQPAAPQQGFDYDGQFNQYPVVGNLSANVSGGATAHVSDGFDEVNGGTFTQPQGVQFPQDSQPGVGQIQGDVFGQQAVNQGNFPGAGDVNAQQGLAGVGLPPADQQPPAFPNDLTIQQQGGLVGGVDLANQQQPAAGLAGIVGGGGGDGVGFNPQGFQQQPQQQQQGGDMGVNSLQIPAETQRLLGISDAAGVAGTGVGNFGSQENTLSQQQHPNAPLAQLRNPAVSDISPTQLSDDDLSEDNDTDTEYDYGKMDDYKDEYKNYGGGGGEGGPVVSRENRAAPGDGPDGTVLNAAAAEADQQGEGARSGQLQQMMDKWIAANADNSLNTDTAGAAPVGNNPAVQPGGVQPVEEGKESMNAANEPLKFQSNIQQQDQAIDAAAAQNADNQPADQAAQANDDST